MKTTSSSDGMKRSAQTSDLLKVTRLTELPFVFVFYLSKECDLRQLRLMLFNKVPPITRLVNLVLFRPAISISSPFSSSSSPFYFSLSLFETNKTQVFCSHANIPSSGQNTAFLGKYPRWKKQ